MNRTEYEKDLKKRQKKHLENVQRFHEPPWTPCMHDSCPECIGTGIKLDGSFCVHFIYCSCPKCSPSYSINPITFTDQGEFTIESTSVTMILKDGNFNGILSNTSNQEG